MYSPGDIELDDIHRRHTERDGCVGQSKPLVASKTQIIVSWLIVLGIVGVIGFIAIAVIFS